MEEMMKEFKYTDVNYTSIPHITWYAKIGLLARRRYLGMIRVMSFKHDLHFDYVTNGGFLQAKIAFRIAGHRENLEMFIKELEVFHKKINAEVGEWVSEKVDKND